MKRSMIELSKTEQKVDADIVVSDMNSIDESKVVSRLDMDQTNGDRPQIYREDLRHRQAIKEVRINPKDSHMIFSN